MAERLTASARIAGRSLTFDVAEALALAAMSNPADGESYLAIEARIQKQFGVSKITVREAARMLTAKGILSTRPRRGTRLEPEGNWNWLDPDVLRWSRNREFSYSFVRELTEFRLAVEPIAAATAASAASLEQKDAIKSALNLVAGAEVGEEDPLRAKTAFHRAILSAAGNRFFAQAAEAVETGIHFEARLANRFKARRRARVLDYARIYRAIKSSDGEAARCSLHAMIQESLDSISQAEANIPLHRESRTPRTTSTRLRK